VTSNTNESNARRRGLAIRFPPNAKDRVGTGHEELPP
jgi:hypothetical protein